MYISPRTSLTLAEPAKGERFDFAGVTYDVWQAWLLIKAGKIKPVKEKLPVKQYINALRVPVKRDQPMSNDKQPVGLLMRLNWDHAAGLPDDRLKEPGIMAETKHGALLIDGSHRLARLYHDNEDAVMDVLYIRGKDVKKIIPGTREYLASRRSLETKAAFFVPALVAQGDPESEYYLGKLHFDQVRGLGNVPMNQEIDYRGYAVLMTPKQFLALAKPRASYNESTQEHMRSLIESGGAIGSPFLDIRQDVKGRFIVIGHEGRNRMKAIQDTLGEVPVLVHLLTHSFAKATKRTPEIAAGMRDALVPEGQTKAVSGPHFGPKVYFKGQWTNVRSEESVDAMATAAVRRLMVAASTDWINDKYKRDLLGRIREAIDPLDFFNTDLECIQRFETLLREIKQRTANKPAPAPVIEEQEMEDDADADADAADD